MMLRGWALAAQGRTEEGIEQVLQSIDAYQATGAAMGRPWHLSFLAEAYRKVGWAKEWWTMLTEVLVTVEKTRERWYEVDLYRLKGELTLAQSDVESPASRVQAGQKSKVKNVHPSTSNS
jgi:hypothetical protein